MNPTAARISVSAPSTSSRLPVLLVHGINDDARSLAPLAAWLGEAGFHDVRIVELRPNNGDAPIAELAVQVAEAAEQLRAIAGCERLDVVGFSMGALVSRYYLQRLEGRNQVRRYLMIVPSHSSRLEGARERTVPVILHPLMPRDGRVLRAVEEALTVERPEDFSALPVTPPPGGP